MKTIVLTETQFKNLIENQNFPNENIEMDPCWKGYEMIGKKKKKGKEVPNCVPKNENYIIRLENLVISKLKETKI